MISETLIIQLMHGILCFAVVIVYFVLKLRGFRLRLSAIFVYEEKKKSESNYTCLSVPNDDTSSLEVRSFISRLISSFYRFLVYQLSQQKRILQIWARPRSLRDAFHPAMGARLGTLDQRERSLSYDREETLLSEVCKWIQAS